MMKQKEPSQTNRPGYIYLLESDHGVKIGRTNNPQNRYNTISVKLPFEIKKTHFFKVDDMVLSEKKLHSDYSDKHINGEWYRLTIDDVLNIISNLKNKQKIKKLKYEYLSSLTESSKEFGAKNSKKCLNCKKIERSPRIKYIKCDMRRRQLTREQYAGLLGVSVSSLNGKLNNRIKITNSDIYRVLDETELIKEKNEIIERFIP